MSRVLVVEDDFDQAEMIAILVQQAGHECRVAMNATDARAVTEDFTPDVALIDIGLPGEDGFQLVRSLRRKPALRDCRFVVLTGYAGADLPRRSAAAGFQAHLTKPVSVNLLLAVLEPCAAGAGDLDGRARLTGG